VFGWERSKKRFVPTPSNQSNLYLKALKVTSLIDISLTDRDFKTVQKLIYQLAGISLGDSKQVMVQGRLSKRMRKLEIDCYSDYISYVQSSDGADEVTNFINALTTNKTEFFRESHHFDFLAKTAFPEIEQRARGDGERKLRIWCSAASTGEEPYTIAMAVREYFQAGNGWDIRILASDIDTDVLHTAETGIYSQERLDDLPPGLQRKYFERVSKELETYSAKDTLRELITFRRLNLHDDQWPINTTFDIIFCRNVLIYFDAPTQQKVVRSFGNYLRRDGYLMLGHSESLHGMSDQFEALGITVYRKLTDPAPLARTTTVAQIESKPPFSKMAENRHSDDSKFSKADSRARNGGDRLSESSYDSSQDTKHAIIVGEIYVSDEPVWITTLLGSCVAVCLFDEVAGVAGMNHFMLPTPREPSSDCNRYGVHSMELLINSLMAHGADRRRMKAKVFGGCSTVGNDFAYIGINNVDFAINFLEIEGIPVVAQFTNQGTGMYIEFHTVTKKVRVRLLDQKTTEFVAKDEQTQAISVQAEVERTACVTLFSGN
jgi:chemotaxis protein methyltransferase CheR